MSSDAASLCAERYAPWCSSVSSEAIRCASVRQRSLKYALFLRATASCWCSMCSPRTVVATSNNRGVLASRPPCGNCCE